MFSAVTFDGQGEGNVQKMTELVKYIDDGHKDVHFFDANENRLSYKDLNSLTSIITRV